MINWDAAVLGPVMAVFGEDLKPTYLPLAGGGFLIDAVFEDAYAQLALDADGAPAIAASDPVIGVRLVQFPARPVKGDKVTLPRVGKTYVVVDVQADSHGHARLVLNEAV